MDGMNRRVFLSTLAAVVAGAALDPERLLWRPGAKTIFLPSPKEVGQFTHTAIAGDALRVGDVITIDGVYAVNPKTGITTAYSQMFVIRNTSTAEGYVELSFNPPVTHGIMRTVPDKVSHGRRQFSRRSAEADPYAADRRLLVAPGRKRLRY